MNRLQAALNETARRWHAETIIAAGRAVQQNRVPQLITYPTGVQMMRFAEPFADFGMHYEISPDLWELIHENDGFCALLN